VTPAGAAQAIWNKRRNSAEGDAPPRVTDQPPYLGDILVLLMPLLAALSDLAIKFGVGLGLFYGVVKFFDTVGEKLNDDTRLEIAVWLRSVKTTEKVETWPATFAKILDRVFGSEHLSWKCFGRSCVATFVSLAMVVALCFIVAPEYSRQVIVPSLSHNASVATLTKFVLIMISVLLITNAVPNYISLLKTRYALRIATREHAPLPLLLILDAVLSFLLGISDYALLVVTGWAMTRLVHPSVNDSTIVTMLRKEDALQVLDTVFGPLFSLNGVWLINLVTLSYPAFFTSIWLWLYAASGFILKGAARFDRVIAWMNRHMDIEKKPLQTIGVVAGAIVALVYWGALVTIRIL
jgi:hypothetical protein